MPALRRPKPMAACDPKTCILQGEGGLLSVITMSFNKNFPLLIILLSLQDNDS